MSSGIDLNYDFFEGRYVLDPKSDVDVHAGNEYLKKRIIRRLLTSPGEFYHLPDYGVGLKVKEPFNSTKLGRLQARIRQQILEEEDVEELSISLASPVPGVLIVDIRAKTRMGTGVQLGLEIPQDGQVIVI